VSGRPLAGLEKQACSPIPGLPAPKSAVITSSPKTVCEFPVTIWGFRHQDHSRGQDADLRPTTPSSSPQRPGAPSPGSRSSTSRSSTSSSRSSPATTPPERSRSSQPSPTSSSPGPRCSTSLCSPTVPPSLPGEVPCHQCSGHDSHRRLHRDELHFQFDAGRYRGWVAELAVRLEEDSPPPSGGSCNMRNPCCKGERKHSCKEIEGENSQGMESI